MLVRYMDLMVELEKIGSAGLKLLWHILHLIVSIWYFVFGISAAVESYIISSGLLWSYNAHNLSKLRHLAIVVESEEAYCISKVIELLRWLQAIGIKSICLYDTDGVLKSSKEVILKKVNNATLVQEDRDSDPIVDRKNITLEFASFADGKEAVAKAANLLFAKYCKSSNLDGDHKDIFSEPEMTEALRAIGCGGPDPDLLLVYGPARCHLGFPVWRIRYTEIVHMGPLNSMKYGSLVKAIHKFTKMRQNYGK